VQYEDQQQGEPSNAVELGDVLEATGWCATADNDDRWSSFSKIVAYARRRNLRYSAP